MTLGFLSSKISFQHLKKTEKHQSSKNPHALVVMTTNTFK